MSILARAATALAVLSVAAIPVAALTIKNNADTEITVGVDTGPVEQVYKVPAGQSVDVKEDCSSGCAVTGPWGYSRMVPQNALIETDGTSLVTANAPAAAPAQSLVPQNPVAEAPDAPEASAAAQPAPPKAAEPAPSKSKKYAGAKKRKPAKQAKKGGPSSGSLQMLFQGPGK